MCMNLKMKIVYYSEYIPVTTANMCFAYKFGLVF